MKETKPEEQESYDKAYAIFDLQQILDNFADKNSETHRDNPVSLKRLILEGSIYSLIEKEKLAEREKIRERIRGMSFIDCPEIKTPIKPMWTEGYRAAKRQIDVQILNPPTNE